MKKKIFFSFACFVGLSLVIAWQFAVAELADLQKERQMPVEKDRTELVSSQSKIPLFI